MAESDRLYHAFDACTLEDRLDAGGELTATRLHAEMASADAGRIVPGITADPALRLPADGHLSPRCVEEIDLAIHAHPTMSEAIGEAALDSLGRVLHI